jgi:hypothetical protein
MLSVTSRQFVEECPYLDEHVAVGIFLPEALLPMAVRVRDMNRRARMEMLEAAFAILQQRMFSCSRRGKKVGIAETGGHGVPPTGGRGCR